MDTNTVVLSGIIVNDYPMIRDGRELEDIEHYLFMGVNGKIAPPKIGLFVFKNTPLDVWTSNLEFLGKSQNDIFTLSNEMAEKYKGLPFPNIIADGKVLSHYGDPAKEVFKSVPVIPIRKP